MASKFESYREQMLLQHEKLAGLQIQEDQLKEHTLLNLKDLNSHNFRVAKLLEKLKTIADKEHKVEMNHYMELEEHLQRKGEAEEPQDQIRDF